MTINLKHLRTIMEMILLHIEQQLGETIFNITDDYYWNIDPDELYNPTENPKELTLGQLSFDWETLQGVLENKKIPIGWHLVPLSSILRNIGERYPQ